MYWVLGQNLVPNPSFEDVETYDVEVLRKKYKLSPNQNPTTSIKLIGKDWSPSNCQNGFFGGVLNSKVYDSSGFIEMYQSDSFFFNIHSYLLPRTGTAYWDNYLFYRQNYFFDDKLTNYEVSFYLDNTLKQTLEKGKTYYVEYYVYYTPRIPEAISNSEEEEYKVDSTKYYFYPSKLGINLSKDQKPVKKEELIYTLQNEQPNPCLGHRPNSPSISSLDNRYYGISKTWERVCGFYTAVGDEKYIGIGNYNQGSQLYYSALLDTVIDFNTYLSVGGEEYYSTGSHSMFIDDVRVEEYKPGMFFKNATDGEIKVCVDSLPYNLSLKDQYTAYNWSNGTADSTLKISENGSYKIDIDAFGCLIHDSVKVTLEKPELLSIPDTLICPQNLPLVISDSRNLNLNYKWSNGSLSSISNYTEGENNWVELSNSCTSFRDSFDIVKVDTASLQLNIPSKILFCENTSLDTTLSVPNYFQTIKWENGDTSHVRGLNKEGIYAVEAKHSCITRKQDVTVKPYPSKFYLSDTIICEDSLYNPPIAEEYDSYLWSNGSQDRILKIDSSGLYILELGNRCGVWKDTILINILNFIPERINDTILSCEKNVPEALEIKVNDNWESVLWSNKETTKTWQTDKEGIYYVQLSNKCQLLLDTFEVKKCPRDSVFWLKAPNVVTANNDFKNDCFKIESYNIDVLSLAIYNRDGKRIFENNGLDWCPETDISYGTYFYNFEYLTPKQEFKRAKGWIMLIK
jgi:hypothetical protein